MLDACDTGYRMRDAGNLILDTGNPAKNWRLGDRGIGYRLFVLGYIKGKADVTPVGSERSTGRAGDWMNDTGNWETRFIEFLEWTRYMMHDTEYFQLSVISDQ